MFPYTGDYIEHIEGDKNNFKYYTFTPRPLMNGDMFKMDDELTALLIAAHHNIDFLEGLVKYAPNKDAFGELMLLKTFLSNVRTNLKSYNPTAPGAVLPALVDIAAYLYNDKTTDSLIQAALVHYQFEVIHPFEQYNTIQYNGIVGRILVPMVLSNSIGEALPMLRLSEYLYKNKNEYFDLLTTTQYSGGYIRWIKFWVNAVGESAKRSAKLIIRYEDIMVKDKKQLKDIQLLPKSTWLVYDYLKRFPVTSISHAAKQLDSSFNSISNALSLLRENGIVTQQDHNVRNRVWEYAELVYLLVQG